MEKTTSRKKRPESVKGETISIKTGCGKLRVTLNDIDGELYEVFLKMGKAGGCANAQMDALGILISEILQMGGDHASLPPKLKGITCHLSSDGVASCADGVGQAIEKWITKNKKEIK